ncbi:MAG TPA: PQQ-dependent sugar dehydrogenase [Dehalococcoidia bacterium]|nr:PQQ-dependent sugar dehydrogenase [Dehalococcoidia bacterium]
MLTGCNAESSVARDTPVPLGATPAVTAGADTTRPQFDPTVVAVLQSADDGIPRRDPPYTYAALPFGYRIESVATGLANPPAFDGAADGRIFVAEQFTGLVRVIRDGVLDPKPFFAVPDLRIEAERGFVSELGLVGLTVEPGAKPLSLLLYYSAQSPQGERKTKLVRVREQNGGGVLGETLLEVPVAPACCHIGGALTWLPDGTLLVGVGDHEQASKAQDLKSPAGKVLRITKVGLAAPDNPFSGRPEADPRVYAYGLRNPFGVAADPLGPKYVLDNGEIGFDTVYDLVPGGNYGWPGSALRPDTVTEEPRETYLESLGVAGAVVYRGKLAAFDGDLFFCQFHRGGALHWFPISDEPFDADRILAGGCSSAVRVLGDDLYFVDYFEGTLYRITQ